MVVVSVLLCRGADSGHCKECVTEMWHLRIQLDLGALLQPHNLTVDVV